LANEIEVRDSFQLKFSMTVTNRKTLVALVGRPNVGKSTLFNMLCGYRKALVHDTPGLTRDRNYAEVRFRGNSLVVVDTGGFEPASDDIIISQVREQALVAIEQADIIVFLGDGKAGINPSDREIVDMLRQTPKRVIYVVNKIDSEKQENSAVEFYELGLEQLFPISALTGYGMDDFLETLADALPDPQSITLAGEGAAGPLVKVAVVGRPNVGKSTLINLLLGENRLLASERPGTTRDSIDTLVVNHGKEYLFIDTAGIRRRSRIVDKVEKYGVIKAFQSIDRADIVLVMLDSEEVVTDQDARIAGYAHERGRGVVLLLNKWDLIKKDSNTIKDYTEKVRLALKYLDYAPILTLSSLTGTRAVKIFGLIDQLNFQYRKRVSTGELNRFLEKALAQHPPGMHRTSKRLKIYYLTQVSVGPPTFAFFCNYPESIHFSYKRFLENQLRQTFEFDGSPLRLVFRKREGKLSGRPHK
jgi:GTPase